MSRRLGPEPPLDAQRLGPPLCTPFAEGVESEHDPAAVAVSVAWDRLRHVEQGLVPRVQRESLEQRARRLAADADLVEALRKQDFAGERFKKFAGRLLKYGYPILLTWTKSGEIFEQCAHAGRPVRRHVATFDWTAEDCHNLATDAVVDGVDFFRRHALERGGWDPQRGASLTTYYIGSCVRCFPPVYNRWWREQILEQGMWHVAFGTNIDDDDPLTNLSDQRAVDPCHAAITNDHVHRVMRAISDPAVRKGIALRASGYSQAEAASQVGLTEKALERRVSRARSKLKMRTDDTTDDRDL